MTSYRHDWEPLRAFLETNPSPVIELLRRFWDDSALSEGAYFEVLGHLARNAAGHVVATHAVSVAAQRLESSTENARVAVDVQLDRCVEAIRAMRFGARPDGEAEGPYAALIAGREALEGLRTLFLMFPIQSPQVAVREPVRALTKAIESAVREVDASVERFGLIERVEAESRSELGQSQYRYLKALTRLHPDDWWNAATIRSHRRTRNALARAAETLRDDFEVLSRWVSTLRPVQWTDTTEAQRMYEAFQQHIDASYRPRHYNSPTVSRVLHTLWDVTRVLLKMLSSREARGELALLLARNATLVMTLYDRVVGTTLPGARVPNDLQRLGWTANAWRTARLLQHQDGVTVVNAFRRHTWWRTPQTTSLEHPEAVAAGCVAAAWYLGQTGYRKESETWLKRAEALVRPTLSLELKPRRLAPIALAHIELSSLYLQAPEDADRSIELATRAISIADECSEVSTVEHLRVDVPIRVRAMMNRASALDFKGDFLLAIAERNAALGQIERAGKGSRRLPGNLLELKWELHFGLGDVDAAATSMLDYVVYARRRGEHELADGVALNRANMLLEYGYQEAGLEALWRLAKRDASSSSVSRARAIIASFAPSESKPETWTLEADAQSLATRARRATGTHSASVLIEHALQSNDRLLALNPEDLVALTRKAQLLIRRGVGDDYAHAKRILDRLSNDDAYVLFCRGHLAYRQQNYVAAASWLREAYELAPRSETAAFLANALLRANQLPAALQAIEAHDSVEDDAPLADARGVIQASRGDYVAAWESFEQVFVAVTSMRTSDEANDRFDLPGRRLAMLRRMAALAPHVAATNRSLVDRFLRRDADIAHRFILTCVRSLAFDAALRESIFACSAIVPLRKAIAQYAMGVCAHEDTMGRPEVVPEIVQRMWSDLKLRDNEPLVAELLAGGKPAYRASIRSALDGAVDQTRPNCARWLSVTDTRFEELTTHIATTVRSDSYYGTTTRLVRKYRDVAASCDALVTQVQTQIPHVRMNSLLSLNLHDVIAEIAAASGEKAHLDAVVQASRLAGPNPVVISTDKLRLPDAPICLVDVTPQTIGLVVRCVGAPIECTKVSSDDAVFSLRIAFDVRAWPANIEALLKHEQLVRGDSRAALFVPVESLPDSLSLAPN